MESRVKLHSIRNIALVASKIRFSYINPHNLLRSLKLNDRIFPLCDLNRSDFEFDA